MTTPSQPRKNIKFIIIGLAVLLVAGLCIAKITLENTIKAWATEDLALYEPMLKLDSAKVEASYLGASVTYKDMVYSMPEMPGLKIVIDKTTLEGLDRDTLMGKPGDVTSVKKTTLSGLRMYIDGMEAPVAELGHYEVSDIAYGYRDLKAALLANKGNNDMRALFKSLAAAMKDYEMKSGPGTMRDFKLNLRQARLADIYLGSISSSGLRSLNREADGYDVAMDSAAYKDIKITGDMFDGSECVGSLDSLEIKGFKYNYRELLAAMAEIDPERDPFALLPALVSSLYNYSFDSISADKLSVNAAGAVFTLDKIALGPRSLKEQGPNIVSDMKLSLNGMDIFTLEAIGMDKLVLSDTIARAVSNPESFFETREFEAIEENPFMALEGLSLQNLYVKNLQAPGIMSLDNWRGDATFGEAVKISSKLDKLHISQMGLRQAGVLGMMFLDPSAQEIIGLLAMNPNGITLDNNIGLDMTVSQGHIGYCFDFGLQASEQGDIAMTITGETAPASPPYSPYGDPMLGSVRLQVGDAGFLDNIFRHLSTQGLGASPAEAKANVLSELDNEMTRATPQEVGLLLAIKSFLQSGGKLDIIWTPKMPMLLEDFDVFDGTDRMNIEVQHTN